jgi:hypothetical protein
MLTRYIRAAMHRARYELYRMMAPLWRDSGFDFVYANAKTLGLVVRVKSLKNGSCYESQRIFPYQLSTVSSWPSSCLMRVLGQSGAELIQYLKRLGFEGPYSGGKHQFMVKDDITVRLPILIRATNKNLWQGFGRQK